MDKYTQLSPEMQELWDCKMKEFKERINKLGREEVYELLKKSSDESCSTHNEYSTLYIPDFGTIAFNLEFLNEVFSEEPQLTDLEFLNEVFSEEPQLTDSRITTLKSQLKHCKNYLERQNIERELNRLYKERK